MTIEGKIEQERNGAVTDLNDGLDAAQREHQGQQPAPGVDLTEDERAAFDKIKQQLADEQRRATDASERARQLEEANRRYQQEAHQGQVSMRQAQIGMVERAIEANAATIENLKREYRDAMQAGDYDKVADVQAQLAEAGAHKVQLANSKAHLERMPEPAQPQQQAQSGDPFEAALQRYTPRTQAWIRQHPDVLKDDRLMKRAMGLHSLAESEGFIPDTDAYFDYMERNLGFKQDQQQSGQQPAARTSRAGMGTPPVRSGMPGSSRNASSMSVKDMTPAMMEAARVADLPPEAWLREYQSLVASGDMQPMH